MINIQSKIRLVCMLSFVLCAFVSCSSNKPVYISCSEYYLEGNSCEWTSGNYGNEVIVINSDEKLSEYIICNGGDCYPKIDFSKQTLLLMYGGSPQGIFHKQVLSLIRLSEGKYRVTVKITTDMTDCPENWTMALLSDKLEEQSSVELSTIVVSGEF